MGMRFPPKMRTFPCRLPTQLKNDLAARPRKVYKNLIAGNLRGTENYISVKNPSTDTVWADVPDVSLQDVNEACESAQAAFPAWRDLGWAERSKMVVSLGEKLLERADEIAEALTREQGKPLSAASPEVTRAASKCILYAEVPELGTERLHEDDKGYTELCYLPRGVVGAITPWNFPVSIGIGKLIPALITGNTVVMKPSPYTPCTAAIIAEVAAEVFPPGVLNIVTGGDEVGRWIVSHPNVKHVTFTGSERTGKAIAQSAAADLKRVTLELGGNDAAIVLDDVDPKIAAKKLFACSMNNTGQVCVAIKRLFVPDSIYDEMLEALVDEASSARFGNGLIDGQKFGEEGVNFGPLNNKPQQLHVAAFVEDAREKGADIMTGGEMPADDVQGYFYPPTIVANAREGMKIVDEEQFGPVLPVIRYHTVEEAVHRANDTRFGLGGSVWTNDVDLGTEIASKLECGVTWVNSHFGAYGGPDVPFGGMKASGIGRENGRHGLLEYVEIKAIKSTKKL